MEQAQQLATLWLRYESTSPLPLSLTYVLKVGYLVVVKVGYLYVLWPAYTD